MADDLSRDLGLWSALAIGVGTMVGAGIFVLPGAATAGAGPAATAAFVLGGAIALFTALTASELSTAFPEAGGVFVYIDEALGPLAGTVAGLGSWLGMAFAAAFYSIGFGEYVAVFLAVPDLWVVSGEQISALVLGGVMVAVNYSGADLTGKVQDFTVGTLLGLLALFALAGLVTGDFSNLRPFAPAETGGYSAIFPATALIFVSYIGFAKIATAAEELENPGRNLPLSIIGSVVITTVVYGVVMVTVLMLLPWQAVAGNSTAVADAGGVLFGTAGFVVLTVGGLLATASSTNAAVLAASRINLATARQTVMSDWLSATNEDGSSPTRAVVLTGALILFFTAVGGIELLAKAGSVLHLVLYGLLNVALVVFRTADLPDDRYDPAFRVPLYPYVPAVGMVLSFGLIAFMAPVEIVLSIVFIVVAVAWYFVYTRTRSRDEGDIGVLHEYLL
ncbi:APC family permease [Haloarcula onubensis]|uniref:APC family permease n=1 Tax=Haloarcula onubensis TaxID=2950539 RepID=A0ABU2FKJ6_9EURY|nr:APC family permease [Halomicroarcula sp. S3CR25-11]MDS0281262.1 APC family permease [Halomicroarcula sp. S3CR25-11]